jgi:alginate O-acetyltransferase complex protein AlgI
VVRRICYRPPGGPFKLLFSSHLFIFGFLPLAIVAIYFVRRLATRRLALCAMILASLLFYYFNGLAQLPVLVLSVLVNHTFVVLSLRTRKESLKTLIIGTAIALNLCLLAYYKYFTFIEQQIEALQVVQWMHPRWSLELINQYYQMYPWGKLGMMVAMPLGISFFTFQQIAYLADIRAGRVPEHRFLDYAFCVTFFPHLIAGPIVNYRELIPQIRKPTVFMIRHIDLAVGLSLFTFGLAKKILIADSLSILVSPAFTAASKGEIVGSAGAWIATLAYTFQLYFDFSGYSDMAIGLARIFGFRLPINFFSPYKSVNIIDFWRRWHITLSRFLRQYLYIPLGGNRRGSRRRYVNLLLTMLIGGLWHGAGWTFAFWGLLHGIYLVINHRWQEVTRRRPELARYTPAWASWLLTFLAVVVAWVFFRAESFSGALRVLQAMAIPDLGSWTAMSWTWRHALLVVAALTAFLMPSTQEVFRRYSPGILPDWCTSLPAAFVEWRYRYWWLFLTALLAGFACFYESDFPQFLYWNF